MNGYRSGRWAATLVLAGALALPVGAAGQLALAETSPRARRGDDPAALEAKAKQLYSTPSRYEEAAKLFRKAAEQRAEGDPVRVADLIMASRLVFYRGEVSLARQLMEQAATESHAFGDVITAANAYIDAAYLARDAREIEKAKELAQKAERLSASPLMPAKDRDSLRARLADR